MALLPGWPPFRVFVTRLTVERPTRSPTSAWVISPMSRVEALRTYAATMPSSSSAERRRYHRAPCARPALGHHRCAPAGAARGTPRPRPRPPAPPRASAARPRAPTRRAPTASRPSLRPAPRLPSASACLSPRLQARSGWFVPTREGTPLSVHADPQHPVISRARVGGGCPDGHRHEPRRSGCKPCLVGRRVRRSAQAPARAGTGGGAATRREGTTPRGHAAGDVAAGELAACRHRVVVGRFPHRPRRAVRGAAA